MNLTFLKKVKEILEELIIDSPEEKLEDELPEPPPLAGVQLVSSNSKSTGG